MDIELTPQQKRIVAAALTTLSAGVLVAAAVILLVYFGKFFQSFESVFLPLAVAAVLAMVIDPWYEWLNQRMPMPLALAAVFLSILLPVAAIFVLFGSLIASQFVELMQQIPLWWDSLVSWFRENRPQIDRYAERSGMLARITDALKNPAGPGASFVEYLLGSLVSASTSAVSAVLSFLGWIIVPVYLAFFLMIPRLRPDALTTDHLPFLKKSTAEDAIFLVREFFRLVVVFFRGQIVIALLMGIMLAVGFTLAGLRYGAVLGLIMGFLNIIPYLGMMVGLSVCLPLAWFQADGGLTLTAMVLGIFCIVQVIEGYFLTPKIMGDATGLNPLVIIIGVFFWGAALNGILGMILAIPLTAFFVVLWRLAREKYIGQLF